MNERQKDILKMIVEHYVDTAQPVGSNSLVKNFDLSSATIRNEMLELEHLGYITQPHVSAGRVPTLKGMHFYLNNLIKETPVERRIQKELEKNKKESGLKGLAKYLAQISNSAVVVTLTPKDIYYTGLTQLFSQPEFLDSSLVRSLSEVVDSLDDLTRSLSGKLSSEPTVFIGRKNPFGAECSAVFISNTRQPEETIIGLLGPVRSNYGQKMALLEEVVKVLD